MKWFLIFVVGLLGFWVEGNGQCDLNESNLKFVDFKNSSYQSNDFRYWKRENTSAGDAFEVQFINPKKFYLVSFIPYDPNFDPTITLFNSQKGIHRYNDDNTAIGRIYLPRDHNEKPMKNDEIECLRKSSATVFSNSWARRRGMIESSILDGVESFFFIQVNALGCLADQQSKGVLIVFETSFFPQVDVCDSGNSGLISDLIYRDDPNASEFLVTSIAKSSNGYSSMFSGPVIHSGGGNPVEISKLTIGPTVIDPTDLTPEIPAFCPQCDCLSTMIHHNIFWDKLKSSSSFGGHPYVIFFPFQPLANGYYQIDFQTSGSCSSSGCLVDQMIIRDKYLMPIPGRVIGYDGLKFSYVRDSQALIKRVHNNPLLSKIATNFNPIDKLSASVLAVRYTPNLAQDQNENNQPNDTSDPPSRPLDLVTFRGMSSGEICNDHDGGEGFVSIEPVKQRFYFPSNNDSISCCTKSYYMDTSYVYYIAFLSKQCCSFCLDSGKIQYCGTRNLFQAHKSKGISNEIVNRLDTSDFFQIDECRTRNPDFSSGELQKSQLVGIPVQFISPSNNGTSVTLGAEFSNDNIEITTFSDFANTATYHTVSCATTTNPDNSTTYTFNSTLGQNFLLQGPAQIPSEAITVESAQEYRQRINPVAPRGGSPAPDKGIPWWRKWFVIDPARVGARN